MIGHPAGGKSPGRYVPTCAASLAEVAAVAFNAGFFGIDQVAANIVFEHSSATNAKAI